MIIIAEYYWGSGIDMEINWDNHTRFIRKPCVRIGGNNKLLELVNIKRSYEVGGIETKALDGISVAFRQKEFLPFWGQVVLAKLLA